MNERQRFAAAMHYLPRDRAPICDFGFWTETIAEWHTQGLPPNVRYDNYDGLHTDTYFGMDRFSAGPTANPGLCPAFEFLKIEDRGDHEVVQQDNGVRVLRKKYMSSIPHHEAHLLTDRESWKKHYKPRLDPDNPARMPKNWKDATRVWTDSSRDYPVNLWCGSLFGWLRDWMGLENIAMLVYDEPAFFEEMVTTLADSSIATLTRCLSTGGQFDCANFWEDMCYNAGPLLSPTHFKRYLVPHYQRITSLLRSHGIDVIYLDCDGNIEQLMPLWLDAGVNCMFPIEIGTWDADPIKYRKQYGKDLLMIGGVDKHILARSKRDIEKEIHRLAPLVEEGGFIPTPDHRVPPDVPYDNYLHYLKTARQIWGKNLNLKPAPALDTR